MFSSILLLIFAYIFLFSATSKMKDYKSHIELVTNYKIFPVIFSKYLVNLFLLIELLASLMIILRVFTNYSVMALSILTVIYSIAIIINLARGRKDLSCGCGGVLGDHYISYRLVIRNLIIIIGLFSSIILPKISLLFLEYINLNILIIAGFIFYLLLRETILLKSKTKELLS
ncbi:MauE/DoxX family redox-associated membrane protein [Psychrobacillus sp. AK 1817]|uniref:MauE/DoxX family redox-associated membrane protein n=1 Tax=Psychrobacillus sp. AK 1817 TaxID=2303505 RepID=UPI001CD9C959